MLFGARVPDEVVLTVLSHLDDPYDLLRVAETCRRALRLARDRPLWEVVLRRSPHERAVRWCSLVLDGIPPHLARGASAASVVGGGGTATGLGEEVSIVEWLRFFARHKRALVVCLRPHYNSDRTTTALAEVLMSREFMTDWLMKQSSGLDSISHALVNLPAQFVYDLLIFPLFEAHLARTTSVVKQTGMAANLAFCKWSSAAIMVPTFWLQERLKASLNEKFLPLLASSLFDGEMELDPARATNAAAIPQNQERLQRACDGMVAMIQSLQFPLEARLLWSHLRSGVRRLHRATPKPGPGPTHREARTIDTTESSTAGRPEATTDDQAAKEEEEEDKVSLLAVGTIAIMRTGFPMFSTRQMLEKLSLQQKRNLLMAAKMLQLLVTHQPTDPLGRWSIRAPHWQCMHGWLEANRYSIDNVLTLASTVSDEEVVGLLRDTVRAKAEPQLKVSTRAADGAQFEAGQAGMLEKHMRFYALDCFRSGGHPRWLLQRMYYLFANVQFTVKLVSAASTAGSGGGFEYVELCAKRGSVPLEMTRVAQQPTGDDGGPDVWQSEVACTCLALMEDPLTTAVPQGADHEPPMGFAFRFGLSRTSPDRETHASFPLWHADPPVWVGVAEVPTQAITAGLPDGSIELDVPFSATTLRQYRHLDDEASSADRAKKGDEAKGKSEKRGWLRGLMQKLHRSGKDNHDDSDEHEESEAKYDKEEKGKDKVDEDSREKEEAEVKGEHLWQGGTLRVVVSFALSL